MERKRVIREGIKKNCETNKQFKREGERIEAK